MSRADDIRARAEAEIAVAELEDRLIEAKDAGEDVADLKLELREARRSFREFREGDANVNPETVSAAAEVKE